MNKITALGLLILSIFTITPANATTQKKDDRNSVKTTSSTKLEVDYKKADESKLNWEAELQNARIIPTLDHKKIRITLPNQDTAKVVISDKKGEKILKRIAYVSPAAIDISNFRNGDYQLIIEMHNVTKVKTFTKEAK